MKAPQCSQPLLSTDRRRDRLYRRATRHVAAIDPIGPRIDSNRPRNSRARQG
jgi:hypothetical protein